MPPEYTPKNRVMPGLFPRRRRWAVLLIGLFSGCSTVVQKAGEAAEGSLFQERTTAVYANRTAGFQRRGVRVKRLRERKGGAESIAVTAEAFPTLRIRGGAPDTQGRFSLNSLEFFCSSLTGWNEFSLELSGTGELLPGAPGFTLRIGPPVESLDITQGKIRRDTRRLSGDQALTALRNRRERIRVLTEWMGCQTERRSFADQDAFADYWKPILFPELVSVKRRPAAWTEAGAVWRAGEGVKWNTVYTAGLLSEELRPVRDSGTLLRDWEEALGWIYLQYQWDDLIQSLAQEIIVTPQ
ncbi:MAG: hypothetical protein LBD37_07920 [Treponema sp.]|jgi:hypothetical protein|nr:hypothetical protein [Treponema sp.]